MTPLGWAAIAAWVVIGLPVAIAVALYAYEEGNSDLKLGGSVLAAWLLAGVVVPIAIGCVLSGWIGRAVRALVLGESRSPEA